MILSPASLDALVYEVLRHEASRGILPTPPPRVTLLAMLRAIEDRLSFKTACCGGEPYGAWRVRW